MSSVIDFAAVAEAALGRGLEGLRVEELGGGYSWETYLVTDGDGPGIVVRIAPDGGTLDPYDPDAERRALRAIGTAVPAPSILLVESDPAVYGGPLQVQTVGRGATIRASDVVRDERPAYRKAMAVTLGHLHREGDAAGLGSASTAGEAVRWVIDRSVAHYLRAAPARHPGFEIGLRWLLSNLPKRELAPVVCHGDYRFNNVLWTGPGEIGTVLDWERAWAGDPMCDIAFTRQFSGWASVDGDAVAEYEAASGISVDERLMTFYLRLERWRSYTASMRGLAAVASGRSQRSELIAIGEAGNAGMWDLVNWIEDDLAPLPDNLAGRPAGYEETISSARRSEIAQGSSSDDPLRDYLSGDGDNGESLARSVALLRTVGGFPRLAAAVSDPDPSRAWRSAYEVVTEAAAEEGRRLHPALQALGVFITDRPTYLPEMQWR